MLPGYHPHHVTLARRAFGSHAVRVLQMPDPPPWNVSWPSLLPCCHATTLPGYHPCQVRVLEMPDKGRLLCATPPLRMSRQPFRLALNGRDFVSSGTSSLYS